MNYYNEFDPKAAAWLQQLIDDKQIPHGYVDSRSILEVHPSDLSGFTQCHFFAGVGGWSLALKLAGWPEDRHVWTSSLPCQPFSTAGKQRGTEDERHLSPTFLDLVSVCRPPAIIGEQVASKLARTDWLPGIRLELEALGYSFGAADLCAPCAGEIGEGWILRGDQGSWERIILGRPHIRQRLYWVADADSERRSGIDPLLRVEENGTNGAGHLSEAAGGCENGGLANPAGGGQRIDGGASRDAGHANECCETIGLPHSSSTGLEGHRQPGNEPIPSGRQGTQRHAAESGQYVLIPCRDGKTRRTQSGIFPLVNGLPRGVVPSGDPGDTEYANATAEARAARLKGYGNAIQIDTAVLFIKSYIEAVNT